MSPRLLSHATPLHAAMMAAGATVTPLKSGSRSGGVQTSRYRLTLTLSHPLSGVCISNGRSGPLKTYAGGVCACAEATMTASDASPAMDARSFETKCCRGNALLLAQADGNADDGC